MKLLRRRRNPTVVPGHASPSLPQQQQQRSSSQECTQQQQQDDRTRSEFDVRLMPRDQIFRRQLTPWSVHSSGSNCWIATIRRGTGPPAFEMMMTMTTDVNGAATAGSNYNHNHPSQQQQQQQRQEQGKVRHVQYSFPTEREARKFCKSYAPPKFQSTSAMCQLCHPEPEQQHQQTTSLLSLQTPAGNSCRTRRFYCRNCGVTICDNCSTRWGIGMVPPTYVTDISQSLTVRVCKACDWLSNAFCLSLLQGRYDDALILHETGNVNLRTSFADIHREAMLPVHCAVMGGNVQLLRWLVDTQLCPVSVRRDPKNGHRPLSVRTSEGRTLLDLAMTGRRPKVDILMYLVQKKGLSIADVKDSTLASKTLETIMKLGLPPAISTQQQPSTRVPQLTSSTAQTNSVEPTDSIVRMFVEEDEEEMCVTHPRHHYSSDDGSDNASSHSDCSAMDIDACALCCDRVMDCVLIPCGHQVCCTKCGNQLQHCPVCKVPCSVLRVFRQ